MDVAPVTYAVKKAPIRRGFVKRAFNGPGLVGPQDGIEPMRRLVKWILSEEPLPGRVALWEGSDEDHKVVA